MGSNIVYLTDRISPIVDNFNLLLYTSKPMPPYNELDPSQRGKFKFIRVDSQLILGDLKTAHRDIAINEGILDNVNNVRLQNRDRVDAGFVEITDTSIDLHEYSMWLGIRVKPEVRTKTVEVFREQTSSREVNIKRQLP